MHPYRGWVVFFFNKKKGNLNFKNIILHKKAVTLLLWEKIISYFLKLKFKLFLLISKIIFILVHKRYIYIYISSDISYFDTRGPSAMNPGLPNTVDTWGPSKSQQHSKKSIFSAETKWPHEHKTSTPHLPFDLGRI